jgi:hypothetical protein
MIIGKNSEYSFSSWPAWPFAYRDNRMTESGHALLNSLDYLGNFGSQTGKKGAPSPDGYKNRMT